ncbi:hypothetical protein M1397_03775 [Candidatus Marsarchaeota archaeon]|jgi:hypothetical protein|nr:hypothetical protein [Candidatus Marsarchaeota archaeon]
MKSINALLIEMNIRLKRSELIQSLNFVFFVYLTTQIILIALFVAINSINLLSIIITFVVSAGAGFLIGVMLIIGMNNQMPID